MLSKKKIKAIEDLTGLKETLARESDVAIFTKKIIIGKTKHENKYTKQFQLDIYFDKNKAYKIGYCLVEYLRFTAHPIPIEWLRPLADILEVK